MRAHYCFIHTGRISQRGSDLSSHGAQEWETGHQKPGLFLRVEVEIKTSGLERESVLLTGELASAL